ncbi:MAG: hypothetical protein A2X49_15675 [Lentisphaerae bacterium GWF2_52_8]|nr:MAG: hypothetical protein A2X49_15675 [Lentisphaerae bacterium GWF2_52_8]
MWLEAGIKRGSLFSSSDSEGAKRLHHIWGMRSGKAGLFTRKVRTKETLRASRSLHQLRVRDAGIWITCLIMEVFVLLRCQIRRIEALFMHRLNGGIANTLKLSLGFCDYA